ncbi:MAG: GNAT family N-acetyltransferase, partial [Actinomycetota bacterium]|nr:GNAT family N-acetyltransferase [Actinomycetota bacterium]
MTVRPATVDDLEGCLDLIAAVVDEGQWLGMQPPFDRAERRERMLGHLADDRCVTLVANDEAGRITGHLGMRVAPHGVAELGMCVAAVARRRGIGSALLKEAVEAALRMGAHK